MSTPAPKFIFGSCPDISPPPLPGLRIPRPVTSASPVPKYPPGLFSPPVSETWPSAQHEVLVWRSPTVAKELAARARNTPRVSNHRLELPTNGAVSAHASPPSLSHGSSASEPSSSPELAEGLPVLSSSTPIKQRAPTKNTKPEPEASSDRK